RQESVEQKVFDFLSLDVYLQRAANQSRASSWHTDRETIWWRGTEQRVLHLTAQAHQGVPLTRRQFFRGRTSEPRLKGVRQGQVEIVAAQDHVIADGDAVQLYRALVGLVCAVRVTRTDQRKVGGAPTNIAHQNGPAGLDERVPIICVCIHPGI